MHNGLSVERESRATSVKLSLSLFVLGAWLNQVTAYFVGKNAIDPDVDSPATQFYGNGLFNMPSLVLHGSVLTYILILALFEKYCFAQKLGMQHSNPVYFDPSRQMIRMLTVEIAAVWGAYIACVELEVSSMVSVVPTTLALVSVGYLFAAMLTGINRSPAEETLLGDGVGLSDLAEGAQPPLHHHC